MAFAVIGASAVLAGFLQAVTGFGSPMILMMVIPYFYNMVASPAVANSISIWLAATLAWKFRKHIDWKSGLFPTVVFFLFNGSAADALTLIAVDPPEGMAAYFHAESAELTNACGASVIGVKIVRTIIVVMAVYKG